ncbi:MAG: type I restriction enzyme HsdR N-terminal domain-containing protein [Bacteroidales bacterium]|jgi:type I restriction enzyme R subunit|nr:type I restriction enzyme HsdR N-terminal domain-containing protein [Bacteroidales bacterium]
MKKDASARIKINDLLRQSGWRFFDDESGKANVSLENQTTITHKFIDDLGNDFETSSKGYVDFLLLDEHSHPIIVLETKSEKHNPLVGKEQARAYARGQNCRFILLSNGNLHYFWVSNSGFCILMAIK